jgi:hypothetical protein
MLKGIEVRIPSVNFSRFKLICNGEGLEYINVVDARMHLDKI